MSEEMNRGSIILYQTPDGQSELFQRNKSTISRHIRNIFEEGELNADSTVAFFATVQNEGKRKVERNIAFYNLDMIISVGYRVNSHRGVQFRIWATQVLREYLIKGFAMNDELLKRAGGGNYFDELLARIRDIRSSEKVFYRKVLEIYALSIDYDPRLPKRTDAEVAKNYLSADELDTLNRIVSLYLDFAELQAKSHQPMYMKDWIQKLDDFLKLSGKELLTHAGKISAEIAKQKAGMEYDKFKVRTANELSPVEIHFLENFEKEQKKLKQ